MEIEQSRKIGFFDSMPHEEAFLAITSRIGVLEEYRKSEVVAYLRNGRRFALVAGVARDILNDKHPVIGTRHILSDGEWYWTEDVIFYVERYGMAPPDDFLKRMRAKNGCSK